MALPGSRNRTYVPGVTPVAGADLNDIQDQIIDLADGEWATLQTFMGGAEADEDQHFEVSGDGRYKHGDIPEQHSCFGGTEGTPGDFTTADGCIVASGGSGIGYYIKPLNFPRGKRIVELGVRVGKADTEHWIGELIEADDGVEDIKATANSAEGTGTGIVTLSLTPSGGGLVIAEGFSYYLKLTRTAPSLDLRFYRMIVHLDHP